MCACLHMRRRIHVFACLHVTMGSRLNKPSSVSRISFLPINRKKKIKEKNSPSVFLTLAHSCLHARACARALPLCPNLGMEQTHTTHIHSHNTHMITHNTHTLSQNTLTHRLPEIVCEAAILFVCLNSWLFTIEHNILMLITYLIIVVIF